MKILSFVMGGALISAATLAAAQTTESPRIFTGSNSTQTVQVQQQGTGMAVKAVTGSNSPAILGQSTNTSGATYGLWGVVSSSQGTGGSRRIECHNWRRGRSWYFSRNAG